MDILTELGHILGDETDTCLLDIPRASCECKKKMSWAIKKILYEPI